MVDEEVKRFLAVRSGDGYGYGYGDGSGSGDGSGDGYGYGYGDGSGIKEYNGQRVYMIDDVPTLVDRVRGDYAKGAILRDDLSLQPCYVARVGNSFAHGDTLHQALADATAKDLEDQPIEERIARFVAEFPEGIFNYRYARPMCRNCGHYPDGKCNIGRESFGPGDVCDAFTKKEQ